MKQDPLRRSLLLAGALTLTLIACRKGSFPAVDGRTIPAFPTASKSWLEGKAFQLADSKNKAVLVEAWHPS